MDIFDFAMEKERLAEKMYRDLAAKAPAKGLISIFSMLADEEHSHFELVSKMKQDVPAEVEDTILLTNSKTIFAKMRQSGENFDFSISEVDLYKKAQQMEKDSRDFYLQKAQDSENPHHKKIFNQLAEEEGKHYFLLENIIEFVSRPQNWLENAEFHHLEQY